MYHPLTGIIVMNQGFKLANYAVKWSDILKVKYTGKLIGLES